MVSQIYLTIDLAIANSGKGAKQTCLLYPGDGSEYPVGFKIQREVRNHRKEGGVHESQGGVGCRGVDLRGESGLDA